MAVVSAGPLMCERPLYERRPPSQDCDALRNVFLSIDENSCPTIYNFHMHTNHSDGQLSPDRIVDQVLEIGLSGFAITDHHSVSGSRVAQQYLQDWSSKPENIDKKKPHLWFGTEITSQLLDIEVHILGYAFDPEHPAIASYLQGTSPKADRAQAHRVVAAIQKSGGIAVLAHPARYRKPYEQLIPAAVMIGIDGVETFYAYGNPKPWKASANETQKVGELSVHYNLLNTCGTDTHGKNLLQRV
jgi:predicted metal-dependent phosphoesterase TrpH